MILSDSTYIRVPADAVAPDLPPPIVAVRFPVARLARDIEVRAMPGLRSLEAMRALADSRDPDGAA